MYHLRIPCGLSFSVRSHSLDKVCTAHQHQNQIVLHTSIGESDIVQHDTVLIGGVEYKSDALKPGRLWQRVHKAMVKLKVPPAIIEHVMKKRDVQILAKNLHDWQGMNKKK